MRRCPRGLLRHHLNCCSHSSRKNLVLVVSFSPPVGRNMTTAFELCSRGYLPRELPPPFNSRSFGRLVRTGWTPTVPKSSLPVAHNLFRSGSLRRELSIPNPLAFVKLAREVELQWTNIQSVLALSTWSMTRPVVGTPRAVQRMHNDRVIQLAHASRRAGKRYVVKADISRFYPSIYTHTLEWAAHSKATVKANRALPRNQQQQLWGRGLDDRHRDLQDRQSIGIPIGPDTSLIVAEMLLARVDHEVSQSIQCDGVRSIDDFELCFQTMREAEEALVALQEILADYQLSLNPSKTRIAELPFPLEESWVRELRRISIRRQGHGQRFDFIDLFDSAFELRNANPNSHILRFAMGSIRHATLLPANWPLAESYLLQAIAVEPGIVREVLGQLLRYRARGLSLGLNRISDTLKYLIIRHAPLGHGSEVAWALWAHIQLGISLDDPTLQAVERMDDPVVILIALDASQRGLAARAPLSQVWNNMMNLPSLTDSGWLLAYEAAAHGWLPAAHLASHPDFARMNNENVRFYQVLRSPANAPIRVGARFSS
jgi:hypothetical protein